MVEWSAAAEELFGIARGEAVGRDLVELIVPAELRESVRYCLAGGEGERARRRGAARPADRDAGPARPTAAEFRAELTIVRAAAAGGGPTVFARDVSHRLEVERTRAHMEQVVAGTQDAVLSKDLDGVVTTWNPAAERLYGYSAEEAIGRHVSFLMPDELKHEVHKILAAGAARRDARDLRDAAGAQGRHGDRRRADDLADRQPRARPLRRLGDRPRHHRRAPAAARPRVPDRRDPRPRRLARPGRDGAQHRRQSGARAGRGLRHRLHPRRRPDRRLGRRLGDPGRGRATGADPPRLAARPGRRPPGRPGAAGGRADDLARPKEPRWSRPSPRPTSTRR